MNAKFTAGFQGECLLLLYFGGGGGLIDIFIVPQPAGLVFMKYEEIAQKCKCLQ